MNLGDKIKRLREQNDLTLEQLAEKIEVAPELISEWETKETFPELDKLLWLSQLFGVPTDYLLSENKEQVENADSEEMLLPYEKEIPNNRFGRMFALGIVLLTLGTLSVLIFFVLLAFNPVISEQVGQQTTGFQAYLLAYPGARQLLIISILVIIIGIVMMTYKQLQKLILTHMMARKTVQMKIGFILVTLGAAGFFMILIVTQYIQSVFFHLASEHIRQTILQSYTLGYYLSLGSLALGIIVLVIEHIRFQSSKKKNVEAEA